MNKIHTKPHWSFWVICIVALIWNLMGSINFFMQMNPDTVVGYSDAAQSLIASRPLWATVGFAIAVFGGVVGDVLLLLKNSVAFYLFVASFICVIVANIHTVRVSDSPELLIGSFMSLVVAAFLIWYSKFAKSKTWIR